MIPDSCIEIHTSPSDRPSVPAWFAEVVIMARHEGSEGATGCLRASSALGAGAIWLL